MLSGSTIGGENSSFMRNLWADRAMALYRMGWRVQLREQCAHSGCIPAADGGHIPRYPTSSTTITSRDLLHRKYRWVTASSKAKAVAESVPGQTVRTYLCKGNIMEVMMPILLITGTAAFKPPTKDGAIDSVEGCADAFDRPLMPHLAIMSTQEAYDYVLDHVGATMPKA